MQPRIDYRKYDQEPLKHLLAIEQYVSESGLEPKLLHLIKMRASQINGCAYCLHMHSIDARANGESEQRLYTLEAWHETPFFSDRERAVLAWPSPLHKSRKPMHRTMFISICKSISPKRKSLT
jgi:AhpD family alkylhydroperoxidase